MDIVKNAGKKISISRLNENNLDLVIDFCSSVVEEVYSYHHEKDWAYDLDLLFKDGDPYSEINKGFFAVLMFESEIVGTAAIRSLSSASDISFSMRDYFSNSNEVAIVNRVYIKKAFRGSGLGALAYNFIERQALLLNYSLAYLSASKKPDSFSFWKKMNYEEFLSEDDKYMTSHMKKNLII